MTAPALSYRRLGPSDGDACAAVLESLPDYFTDDTYDEARAACAGGAIGWVAVDEAGAVVGFVLAERRFAAAAEITFAAVAPERRGGGVGTGLVERTLGDLGAAGVAVVEVKTLDASAGYEPYVATRAFWEARGFVQVDAIDPFPGWMPGNPCAIYVRAVPLP